MIVLGIGGSIVIVWLLVLGGYSLLTTRRLANSAKALAVHQAELARAAERKLQGEEQFRRLVQGVKDYAILMLDPEGRVVSWNEGAQRIKGYSAAEIIGQHFSRFYAPEDIEAGEPARGLKIARQDGRFENEGWRVRKDGSRFLADVIITAMYGPKGEFRGFSKVTRDITERKRAEEKCAALNESERRHAAQLEVVNKELEAFSYSVSHDLRAPLRSIDGFSSALMEDYADKLDEQANSYLRRIRAATQRMAQLIDDLLKLAFVTRSEMHTEAVDLSALANGDPGRVPQGRAAASSRNAWSRSMSSAMAIRVCFVQCLKICSATPGSSPARRSRRRLSSQWRIRTDSRFISCATMGPAST